MFDGVLFPADAVATIACENSEVLEESVVVAVMSSPAVTAEDNAMPLNVALPLPLEETVVVPR